MKLKKIALVFVAICITLFAHASTSIISATVSGEWTLAGSPYLIYNNITIDVDSILTIDPGVEIIFQGPYSITVNGILSATGNSSQYINFHVNDTTGWSDTGSAGGWDGITFNAYGGSDIDTSSFRYCNFYYMKTTGVIISYRTIPVLYCSFYNNQNTSGTGILDYGLSDATSTAEVRYCSFYNNSVGDGDIIDLYGLSGGTFNFYNNSVYSNWGGDMLDAFRININIVSNSFYQNDQPVTSDGGVIAIWNCKAVLNNNMVYENTTKYDGAIFCNSTISDIDANYICNNDVTDAGSSGGCAHVQGGGGIRIDDEGDTVTSSNIIRNNIIANNRSAYFGGGIYVIGANATICNNDIINNIADQGGIFLWGETGNNIKIKNNILFDNVSLNTTSSGIPDTMNVHVGTADTLLYEYNWTQHTYSGDVFNYLRDSFILTGDTTKNVIGNSPDLVSPTLTASYTESALTANFDLLSTSPCIDSGNTAGIDPGFFDYAGNHRTIGGSIDIGAYEYGATTFPMLTPTTNVLSTSITIYPNPAVNECIISNPAGFPAGSKAELYDINGRLVNTFLLFSTSTTLSVADITPGVYQCNIMNGDKIADVKKLVIVK